MKICRNDSRRTQEVGRVEWIVAGKIRVENAARVQLRCFGKSVRVGWKVAAKNPGDLRRSAGVDGKMPE